MEKMIGILLLGFFLALLLFLLIFFMANETVPPWMLSDDVGAYYGKILICAPIFRY